MTLNYKPKLYYHAQTHQHFISPNPTCSKCASQIQGIAYYENATISPNNAVRRYYCEQCMRNHQNKKAIIKRVRVSLASEVGKALVVETPDLLADTVIYVPVKPASLTNSNVSLAHAATPSFDRERGGPPPQIIDRTVHAGRDQSMMLGVPSVKQLIEAKDRPLSIEQASKILQEEGGGGREE